MAQKTTTSILEVLTWIENTPHYQAETIENSKGIGMKLSNHHDSIRFYNTLLNKKEQKMYLGMKAQDGSIKDIMPFVTAGTWGDSRMYRASNKGRQYMMDNGVTPQPPVLVNEKES